MNIGKDMKDDGLQSFDGLLLCAGFIPKGLHLLDVCHECRCRFLDQLSEVQEEMYLYSPISTWVPASVTGSLADAFPVWSLPLRSDYCPPNVGAMVVVMVAQIAILCFLCRDLSNLFDHKALMVSKIGRFKHSNFGQSTNVWVPKAIFVRAF